MMLSREQKDILDLVLKLLMQKSWHDLSIADIAIAQGVSSADIYRHFDSKKAIVHAISTQIDEALANQELQASITDRKDVLFDLIMTRIDLLLPYKGWIRDVWANRIDNVCDILLQAPQELRSIEALVNRINFPLNFLQKQLFVHALGLVYLNTLLVWLDDDETASKTMATLDDRLHQLSEVFKFLKIDLF